MSINNIGLPKKSIKLGVITSPFLLAAGVQPLKNLLAILSEFSSDILIFTGEIAEKAIPSTKKNKIFIIQDKLISQKSKKNIWYIIANLKIVYQIYQHREIHAWFFFLGEGPLIVPIFTCRLLNKPVIFISSGSLLYLETKKIKTPLGLFIRQCELITPNLCQRIIISSDTLISEKFRQKYKNKLIIASEHYINREHFKIDIQYEDRPNVIAFVGRLSEEKGIKNFLDAIPPVLNTNSDIIFLIAGNGPLEEYVLHFIKERDIEKNVKYVGWIDHARLPEFLNNVKVMVISSYSETGPQTLLEAMACGVVVLSTKVGLVPNLLIDGQTGYILRSNNPEDITDKILDVMKSTKCNEISGNARTMVISTHDFITIKNRYRKILESLDYEDRSSLL